MDKRERPASLDRIKKSKSAEDRLLEELHQEMLYLCEQYDLKFEKPQ